MQSDTPIVAIGYSAGGLEALKALLQKLSSGTGMAFVIVSDLKGDEKRELFQIISSLTKMNVKIIEEEMEIEKDTVFILPPGQNLSLSGEIFTLGPQAAATGVQESVQEELTSTNTAKKDLQVTNEELQRRNRELAESEERFRLMIENIKDYAIFMLDPEGHITTWNEGAKRFKEYDRADIIGQHFSKFYLPEERHWKPKMELEQAVKTGRYEEEGWRLKKDGSRFWANVVISAVRDESGKLRGFTKVTRDLTERKILEELRKEEQQKAHRLEQLQDTQRNLDQIFNESPAFMAVMVGKDHVFDRANQKYFELLNKDRSIIGKKLKEVLPEFETQGFIKHLDDVFQTGVPYRVNEAPLDVTEPSGRTRRLFIDFVYQPLRNSDGVIYAIIHLGYDATEKALARKAVENAKNAIENERANFRNLFKQTPEMVCILSGPDHIFEFVNEAHVKVLGFDATGMTVRQAQPESVEVHGILDNVYRTGKTAELHEIPVTVTGKLRYFNLTYSAKRNSEGQINGIMILGIEVTEQVRNRAKLEQAVRARDEFLSIASHELKTPLTSLQMQAQLRERNVANRNAEAFTFDKLKKMFDGDIKQIHRLTRLIEDMLDVTRIVSRRLTLRPETVDLCAMIREVVERIQPQFDAAHTH